MASLSSQPGLTPAEQAKYRGVSLLEVPVLPDGIDLRPDPKHPTKALQLAPLDPKLYRRADKPTP
jgi:hypothetical protein